ncbi:UNVERIFIED_CONTAM: hypothetical protein K2H54_050560 [Gekko kuhli]
MEKLKRNVGCVKCLDSHWYMLVILRIAISLVQQCLGKRHFKRKLGISNSFLPLPPPLLSSSLRHPSSFYRVYCRIGCPLQPQGSISMLLWSFWYKINSVL